MCIGMQLGSCRGCIREWISNYAQQMEMIRMDVTCWYLRISFMFGNDDIRLFHLQFARMEINYAREI